MFYQAWIFAALGFLVFPRSAERSEDEYVQQEKRRKIDELVRVETELLRLKLDAQATVHFLINSICIYFILRIRIRIQQLKNRS
jgi:hypothetical protein